MADLPISMEVTSKVPFKVTPITFWVDIFRTNDGKLVVVITETQSNKGCSITNCFEHLATYVRDAFDLDPKEVIWVEHYEKGTILTGSSMTDGHTFDCVELQWDGKAYFRPQWKYLARGVAPVIIEEDKLSAHSPLKKVPR